MSSTGLLLAVFGAVLLFEAVKHFRGATGAPLVFGSTSSSAPAPSSTGAPANTGAAAGGGRSATASQAAELYNQILAAGGSTVQAVEGTAIAIWESDITPGASNLNSTQPGVPPEYVGTIDRGLFQFNSKDFANISDSCAYDPACSIRAFVSVTAGNNFAPWNGDLSQRQQFKSFIEAAVQRLFPSQPVPAG